VSDSYFNETYVEIGSVVDYICCLCLAHNPDILLSSEIENVDKVTPFRFYCNTCKKETPHIWGENEHLHDR